jgi:hypothetical protein
MAKLENTRKTGKDYQDEYRNAMLKVAHVEVRIYKRALTLCKAHPDVVIDSTRNFKIVACEYFEANNSGDVVTSIEKNIEIIKKIEQYIADKHPHKQLTIQHDMSENAVRIPNPEAKDNRY